MDFKVVNQDRASVECLSAKNLVRSVLILSLGGIMGGTLGLLFAVGPYVNEGLGHIIPTNWAIAATFFVIAAIAGMVGRQVYLLRDVVELDRVSRTLTKYVNSLWRQRVLQESFGWDQISTFQAREYVSGDSEGPSWGGVLVLVLKGGKKVEILAGKGKAPDEIVEGIKGFMKAPPAATDLE